MSWQTFKLVLKHYIYQLLTNYSEIVSSSSIVVVHAIATREYQV
jgi:hypothetical protein